MSISLLKNSGLVNTGASVDIGSGSTRLIVYMARTTIGSDSVTAVQVGSLSLTKVGSRQTGAGNRYLTMWAGYPTQTGSQTLTVTGTEAGGVVLTYNEVLQTGQPKNFASSAGNTSGAVSLSVTANNGDWLIGACISDVGDVDVGANTTAREDSGSAMEVDSNGVASPTALNFTLAGSGGYAIIGAAFAPTAGSSSPSPSSSVSPSISRSPSPSSSLSPSASPSPSSSISRSPSPSSSVSLSLSPSSSASASTGPTGEIALTIAGVNRTRVIEYSSLRITQVLTSEPDSCEFVYNKFGSRTYIPEVEEEVIITMGDDIIFAGQITEIEEIYNVGDYISYRIFCSDYTFKINQKLVLEIYENMSVSAILSDIKSKYLPNDVTINCDVVETIDYAAFNYESVSECIRQLAELCGADWYIDYNKVIQFHGQNTQNAIFNLSDTGGKYIYDSLKIRRDQTQMRNIVYVRGGEYLGNTVTSVQDGNGAQRFFYLPYKMSHLTLTVTGSQKSVGVDPIDDYTQFDAMHNFQEKTVFFRSDRIPRNTSALAASQKVRIGGNPNLPVIAKVRDLGSIGMFTGREHVIVDDSIKSKDGAYQRGYAELATYRTTLAEAEFDTYERGLHTGQKITVQSDLRGIDEDYIINRIEWKVFGMDQSQNQMEMVCHVSLVTTRTFGYTQLIQRLVNKEKKQMTVNVDERDTLDSVESVNDSISISETVTSSLSHNPQAETITFNSLFTSHINYGEEYVLGPWTGGFPHDSVGTKKRLFILDGSPLG